MSHYPGVTVLVCFSFVYHFCLLFVCWYLPFLSVCFAVCMSYLSVCVHNLVLYLRFVHNIYIYGPMAKIQ